MSSVAWNFPSWCGLAGPYSSGTELWSGFANTSCRENWLAARPLLVGIRGIATFAALKKNLLELVSGCVVCAGVS